ncbi:MAG: hypothetical protein Kow00124_15730 [Anaerolineae bacterium]
MGWLWAAILLVVTENAYPGWTLTIEGERAACIPAGEHNIEWRFRPALLP